MRRPAQLPLIAAAFIGGLTFPTHSALAENDRPWHFDAAVNLFLAGMSGDVTAKGLPASLDASFGDVLENLEAAFAGRVTANHENWFLSAEFSYLNLAASVPAASADLKQWLVEPSVGYAFCDGFAVFAGTRYNNLHGNVTFNSPASRVATGTQDWWDPIIGAQFSLPLVGDKLSIAGRFDVGGFGVGADLTWQAHPFLHWRINESTSLQLGYRWLATDYETGSGLNKFRYDVIVEGAQVGLTLHF
jgi:hypothetical protein